MIYINTNQSLKQGTTVAMWLSPEERERDSRHNRFYSHDMFSEIISQVAKFLPFPATWQLRQGKGEGGFSEYVGGRGRYFRCEERTSRRALKLRDWCNNTGGAVWVADEACHRHRPPERASYGVCRCRYTQKLNLLD